MTVRLSFLPLAAILCLSSAPTYLAAQAASTDPYKDEPFVFESIDTTTTMKADGTGDVVQHMILRVQTDGVARQFSVLSLPYASANSTATIDFVRVHKSDGSTVSTPTDDAMEMPAEVSREAPMYSDVKEKHLPVRSLGAGDSLEYQFHTTITKAQAPGQFWGAQHFQVQSGVVLRETHTLKVPDKTYVQVWSPNHPVTPIVKDGLKTWTWTSSQIKASARDENGRMAAAVLKDPDEDADGRKLPSIAWTTFHSWAEVGDWYRSLAEQRLQPSATVRAKADELTKNAKSPQEQAEALYRFVATQIRYISISFGVGRFQPHTPDEVLDHGYGDCKDKDTLLESMLRAKGLTTAPVLIGAGIAPVPDVPSPAVFNHAITTVNLPRADGKSERIWLDSTAEVAPFRVLMPIIRDQQALVISDKAPASLEKTPASPPYAYKERFESVGTLDEKGMFKAHITMTLRSDAELLYRVLLQRLAPAQWDEAMQGVMSSLNFGGKVSHADLRQSDSAAPVHVSLDYVREEYGDRKSMKFWGNVPPTEITYLDHEKAPEHDIDLGTPRTLEAHSEIAIPAGDHLDLPNAIHVERPYTSYNETYRFVEGKFIEDRVIVVKQHKLPRDQWKDYNAFIKEAGLEGSMQEATLIVSSRHAESTVAVSSEAVDLNTGTARQLQDEAVRLEKRGDWENARRYAEKAVERFPDQAYSHSVLAYMDAHDKKYDRAIAGYKAELAAHTGDSSNIVDLLARVYLAQKDYPSEIALLKQYEARKDPNLRSLLVNALWLSGDRDGSLALARAAVAEDPNNKNRQTTVANLLYQMHRNPEAIAAATRALEQNDDPNLLNDNAYYLVEMKAKLPLAESSSRRSVELFDKMNSTGAVDEANTRAFALSSQMVAAWDTLGDILLTEGKLKAAESYQAAAWFDSPDPVKGNHLAQIYEAEGRKEEARWIDALALSIPKPERWPDDLQAIKDREARMEKEGVVLASKPGRPASAQDLRTFHLRRDGASGSAVVRVQLGGTGIVDAMLVSGDRSLQPLIGAVKKIDIPQAVPGASPARVLRDAVLTCGNTAADCDFVFMERNGLAAEADPK